MVSKFLILFAMGWLGISAQAKISVVAAQPLLADLAQEIAGDTVGITCLLAANADPHSYEPTPSDLRNLVTADVVIVNGLGLEPWVDRLVEHSGFHGLLVTASDGCPSRLHLATPAGQGNVSYSETEYDPHAWHDPENIKSYVRVIRDALKKSLPAAAAIFQERSRRYLSQIEDLENYATQKLATIPADQRKLVTSHDSLQYFAHVYGFIIVPIAGSRPDQEPSARELARLISLIREEQVRAVFFEPTSSPKLAQLVAEEAHVTVVRALCTDGLGMPGTPAATYLGMFRTNIDTIVQALR